jgi:hypothetical protein
MQMRSLSASLLPGIIDELRPYSKRNGKKNARMTDLLKNIDCDYCTDGHGDINDRPWHSVVLWQD